MKKSTPIKKTVKQSSSKPSRRLILVFGLLVMGFVLYKYVLPTPETASINKIATRTAPQTAPLTTAPLPTLAPSTQRVRLGPPSYSSDFSTYWETRYVIGNLISRAYGTANGLTLSVLGGSPAVPTTMHVHVPYQLPTSTSYSVGVETQLVSGKSKDAWVRLVTNYSENGHYTFSIFPTLQSYELKVIHPNNPSADKTYSGQNTAIAKDAGINRIRIDRNPSNGILEAYVNNNSVIKISDKTFVGGGNRLHLTGYTPDTEVVFRNFTVSPIYSTLN